MYAHLYCSVRAFELDHTVWTKRGCAFLDTVSIWDFETIQEIIIKAIKNPFDTRSQTKKHAWLIS